MNKELLKHVQEIIDGHQQFVVTSHVNPDGDAVASLLIAAALLKKCNKQVRCIIDDQIPRKFDYLAGVRSIEPFTGGLTVNDETAVFVVDASSPERTGRMADVIQQCGAVINIDHHVSNTFFGTANHIDAKASSTAELVYTLYDRCAFFVTPELASLVYTGVICDTGRFLFANTTASSLALCAEMVEKGADPAVIAGNIYHRNSQGTMRALAEALATLEFHFEGSVACIHLTSSHKDDIDTEGFVDYLLSIEGTEVQIFMIENEPDEFRVSIRSKSNINVNDVAVHFGGGGHPRAAGCVVRGQRDAIKQRLLQILGEQICTV